MMRTVVGAPTCSPTRFRVVDSVGEQVGAPTTVRWS